MQTVANNTAVTFEEVDNTESFAESFFLFNKALGNLGMPEMDELQVFNLGIVGYETVCDLEDMAYELYRADQEDLKEEKSRIDTEKMLNGWFNRGCK